MCLTYVYVYVYVQFTVYLWSCLLLLESHDSLRGPYAKMLAAIILIIWTCASDLHFFRKILKSICTFSSSSPLRMAYLNWWPLEAQVWFGRFGSDGLKNCLPWRRMCCKTCKDLNLGLNGLGIVGIVGIVGMGCHLMAKPGRIWTKCITI